MDLKTPGGSEERINEALDGPLKSSGLDFTEEPLESVVNFLQDEYEIPIQMDMPALAEAGRAAGRAHDGQTAKHYAASAMRMMLKQHQLTYMIQDEVMMITTPEQADKNLVAKVYPVADLVLPIESPRRRRWWRHSGGWMAAVAARRRWRRRPWWWWRRLRRGGGGGGGLGGGGGGGLFSVPDDGAKAADKVAAERAHAQATNSDARPSRRPTAQPQTVASIKIDESVAPTSFGTGISPTDAIRRRCVRRPAS